MHEISYNYGPVLRRIWIFANALRDLLPYYCLLCEPSIWSISIALRLEGCYPSVQRTCQLHLQRDAIRAL